MNFSGCMNSECQITFINPLNAELNPIYHLLALLGAHHILHVRRIRVKQIERKKRCNYKIIFLNHTWNSSEMEYFSHK